MKRNLTDTLKRWNGTDRPFHIEQRGDIYELRMVRGGTTVQYFISELELSMTYGNTWRSILSDIIRNMRYQLKVTF